MVEKDFYKIKYAQLLSASDDQQIMQHLEHVNQKGDLVFLISGVINFWMDNANDMDNAQNADLALRKLATILNNIESEVIESILDNIHEHEVKDKLTEFLVKDINQLMNLYHKKKDSSTILKFSFLMNFVDYQTLLKILTTISGEEVHAIIEDKKSRKLFGRVLSHILKQAALYKDVFTKNSFVTTLLSFMQTQDNGEFNLNVDDDFQNMLQGKPSSVEIINKTDSQLYSILQMVDNWNRLDPKMQSLCTEDIMPELQKFSLGKLLLEILEKNNSSDIEIQKTKPANGMDAELASKLNDNFQNFKDNNQTAEIASKFKQSLLDNIGIQISAGIGGVNTVVKNNIKPETSKKGKTR